MKSNATKSTRSTNQHKPASSSTRSRRPTSVPESGLPRHDKSVADELDGALDRTESPAVENQTGDRILAETGIDSEEPRLSVLESELRAITLHQPWASLIAVGAKTYETRSWSTNYRGPIAIHAGKKPAKWTEHYALVLSFIDLNGTKNDCEYGAIIAIAELTDCIQMTSEFIAAQSKTELRCGDWTIGRYAWKLENVRTIEPVVIPGKQGLWIYNHSKSAEHSAFEKEKSALPVDAFGNIKSNRPEAADCGEVLHLAEANGQLNLLKWNSNEPPEPDDFPGDLEAFKAAYLEWMGNQTDDIQFKHQDTDIEDLWNQSAAGIGLICAAESAPVSLMPESSNGDAPQTSLSNGMTGAATQFSENDFPMPEDLAISKSWILGEKILTNPSNLLPPAPPANHSRWMESDSEPTTIETVSPPSSLQSNSCDPTLQSSKTLPDCLVAPTNQQNLNRKPEATLDTSSGSFPKAGTMSNGKLSAAPILERPGVESDSLLLRSPGAMSGDKNKRPPGQTRLDNQLKELELMKDGEVAAPEFLENGYSLPTGWTNPEENRTAIELNQVQAQQLPTDPNLELPLATELTATVELPSETPLIGELQPSHSNELNISPNLSNLGSFSKESLIEFASAAHISIGFIALNESDLAMQKLDQARIAGLCLKEFKRKCGHGEFENNLNKNEIAERTAQTYMAIARDWDIISQASREIVTAQSQTLSLNWASKIIKESKRALKSAAPPADPDCWRTPNTKEQPIVQLVMEALGGEIWCDPCADAGHRIPARVHYNTSNNGLNARNLWTRTVFINPPFSDPLPWVDKCCDSIIRGDCSQAIMLLKAGTLSNQGTGELIKKVASGICHWRGRINFLNDNGIAVKGSDFDCVLIYFGHRFDRFQETFETFGTVSFIENHYSSVNKRPVPTAKSVVEESKELAAAVGLSNGKSGVFPDKRDIDREMMERCDPHTVDDRPFTSAPAATVEPTRSEALAQDRFKTAKENCLKDYITAISGNLSDFSDDQIAFLAKIINEESAKRIS